MDPWQTSVEKRLDSLDRRLSSIEADAGSIKVDVATVKTNVSHLPSKGFIVTTVILGLTALSLIVGTVANLDRILPSDGSSASSALQVGEEQRKP